jgi:mannosyltransferase
LRLWWRCRQRRLEEELSVAELAEREQAPGPAPRQTPGTSGQRRTGLPGWLVVAVPAVAAFFINLAGLSGPSLWRDEAYTKDAISRSITHIFALLGHNDAVHGFYYVIIHFYSEVAGTSDFAMRFPSVCAMAVATGFTAAVARRATTLAGLAGRWPDVTAMVAGLVFATSPYMTYYAQMARPYAFVTMCATIASYVLLRAYADGGWRWWTLYGVAVGFTGLFNTFGLLIIPAHALTILAAGGGAGAGVGGGAQAAGSWVRRVARPWLIAAAVAVIALGPLLLLSYRERGQISWLSKPDRATVEALVRDFAGSRRLLVPVGLLALGGVAAGIFDGRFFGGRLSEGLGDGGRRLTPAAIALPWLVVPPVVLIAVSMVKPVYNLRYVEYCLPALAILVAAGLVGLIRLLTELLSGSTSLRPAAARRAGTGVAAVVLAAMAVLLISPQHSIRQSSARPDNLRLASQIVAANERPGDIVFYIPVDMHVLGTGYPAPFLKLRDIALGESPIQSGTLTGTEISSPAELASRFTDVTRVWVVTGSSTYKFPVPSTALDKEKLKLLSGMHILHRWMAGEVMLTLYGY